MSPDVPGAAFQPTLWTVVLRAKSEADPDRRTALNRLFSVYWTPVYAFLRRRGLSKEEAEDATQGFFAHFLEKELLLRVDREKGKFRSYLLATLEYYLANERRIERAAKRGGGTSPIRLDFQRAETTLRLDVSDEETPDAIFRRSWAMTVLQNSFEALQREFESKGQSAHFDAIRAHLSAASDRPGYGELATKLGCSVTDITNLLHRARKRLRDLIRSTLRETVETDDEVEGEIRDLFQAL